MEILFLILTLVTMVSLLVKIANITSNKKQQERYKELLSNANIVSENVSYSLYKKVARRASVKNTTVRLQGDFFDFILSNIDKSYNSNCIENQLASTNFGDENE